MVSLREAQFSDLPLMMAWRSSPLVFQGFYQQTEPLKWEEHVNWFMSRNRDWRTLIIEYEGTRRYQIERPRPVGVVTIGQLDNWSPEIGYYIGEVSLWGNGVAKEAVAKTMVWLQEVGYKYCHTTVLDHNERSIKLLKRLGFKKFCKAREGESRYEVNLWK